MCGYAAACVVFCVALLDSTAFPVVSAEPAAPRLQKIKRAVPSTPLSPVTPETLTELRASARIEAVDNQLTQTDNGPILMSDGMATYGSAVTALEQAFRVPFCGEYAYAKSADDRPRFPFAIEANERLADALDELQKNSNGWVRCMLLHGRIVTSAQRTVNKGETYIMDRRIQVELEADTLGQALEQLEAAYNKQYPDIPLIMRPWFSRLLLEGPPANSALAGKFVLKQEGALRDVLLELLEQMQDIAMVYDLSEMLSIDGLRYFAVMVRNFDASIFDKPGEGERAEVRSMWERSDQRLAEYLSRAKKAGMPASTSEGQTMR